MLNKTQPLSIIYNQKSGFHASNKDGVCMRHWFDLTTYGYEYNLENESGRKFSGADATRHTSTSNPNNLGIVVVNRGRWNIKCSGAEFNTA